MPTFLNQNVLISCMGQMGYNIDQDGMCFGISQMAIQALLAKDLGTFMRRLESIASHQSQFETYFKALPSQERNNLLAFFDGIALYHEPQKYQHTILWQAWLEKEDNTLYQKHRIAQEFVRPVILDKKEIMHLKLGTIGFHDIHRLNSYLQNIIQHFGRHAFALATGNTEHAITILYDPTGIPPIALCFDPNNMPTQCTNDAVEKIAETLWKGLKLSANDELITISTTLFTLDQQAKNDYLALGSDQTWKQLKDINNQISTTAVVNAPIDSNALNKLFRCAFHDRDEETCREIITYIQAQGADPYRAFNDTVRTDALLYTKGIPPGPIPKSQWNEISELSRQLSKTPGDDANLLATLKFNGLILASASEEKKNDPQYVHQAYLQNPSALQYSGVQALAALLVDEKISMTHVLRECVHKGQLLVELCKKLDDPFLNRSILGDEDAHQDDSLPPSMQKSIQQLFESLDEEDIVFC